MNYEHKDYSAKIEAADMYSYSRPAWIFWNAAMNTLIQKHGMTETQAIEWLRSKHARWMLDRSEEQIENAAELMINEYAANVHRALTVNG
jgi:hypothetical protein